MSFPLVDTLGEDLVVFASEKLANYIPVYLDNEGLVPPDQTTNKFTRDIASLHYPPVLAMKQFLMAHPNELAVAVVSHMKGRTDTPPKVEASNYLPEYDLFAIYSGENGGE